MTIRTTGVDRDDARFGATRWRRDGRSGSAPAHTRRARRSSIARAHERTSSNAAGVSDARASRRDGRPPSANFEVGADSRWFGRTEESSRTRPARWPEAPPAGLVSRRVRSTLRTNLVSRLPGTPEPPTFAPGAPSLTSPTPSTFVPSATGAANPTKRKHAAPPPQLVDAVRARYPAWAKLSLESVALARQHPLPWLLKVIEDLYDARYAHDVAELEYLSGGDPDDADADDLFGAHPFPDFVHAFLGRQYGVRSLAEKAAWEVMCNAEAARSAGLHASVDLFCAFCNLGYDDEELMFFLYVRQTLLMECARGLGGSDSSVKSDAARRFHAGAPTPAAAPNAALTERAARDVTRRVFGGAASGGMLYQAVSQLVGDYFDERRAAIREEAKAGRGEKNAPALMDAYYYLKLMLSAYRDTRPGASEGLEGAADSGFDDGAFDYAHTDAETTFDETNANGIAAGDEEHENEERERDDGFGDEKVGNVAEQFRPDPRATRAETEYASPRSTPGSGVTAGGEGDTAVESRRRETPTSARGAPPPAVPPGSPPGRGRKVDPRGASVRVVRRAITDSCSKYCDVLLQVAQDLPPDALADLKAKATSSLDETSQELFTGALSSAFGVDVAHSPGGDAATRAAANEPDVVAAVSRSMTAMLRKTGGNASDGGGAAEAREIARVVLASRTIRLHVEPLLTRLLSELDEEEEDEEDEEDEGGTRRGDVGSGEN